EGYRALAGGSVLHPPTTSLKTSRDGLSRSLGVLWSHPGPCMERISALVARSQATGCLVSRTRFDNKEISARRFGKSEVSSERAPLPPRCGGRSTAARLAPYGPISMEWINYHHLLYFFTVAREGSLARASAELGLAPSTISGQIRSLE